MTRCRTCKQFHLFRNQRSFLDCLPLISSPSCVACCPSRRRHFTTPVHVHCIDATSSKSARHNMVCFLYVLFFFISLRSHIVTHLLPVIEIKTKRLPYFQSTPPSIPSRWWKFTITEFSTRVTLDVDHNHIYKKCYRDRGQR